MSTDRTQMPADGLQVAIAAPDSADARWCLDQYFRDLIERVEGGFDRTRTSHVAPDEIAPPNGLFLIARLNGRPIGCGALKLRDGVTGEVKRMWAHQDARGQGAGRRILETLERLARDRGLRALRLDTNRALKEAQALYRSCSLADVAPFNNEPFAHHWLKKRMT